ncbi:MAG: hypothetical protein E7390_04745 [Ruminococcaceae bacterium]|nr:hypothetical protein [Oscillospiraceae bacterium]
MLAILLFIILSVVDIWNAQNSFVAVILLAFGAMGTIDMICSKLNFTKKKIRKLCRRIADYFSDKKKEEYESILGNISYDEIE